jgi:hypothetical protein
MEAYLSNSRPKPRGMMAHHIRTCSVGVLAGAEKRNPECPVNSRLDRFFSLYPGVSRDPNEDTSYGFEQVSASAGIIASYPEGWVLVEAPIRRKVRQPQVLWAIMGDMPGWWQALNRGRYLS